MNNNIAARILRPISNTIDDFKALSISGKFSYLGSLLVKNAIYIIIVALVIYVQVFSIQRGFTNTFLSFDSIIDIVRRAGSSMFLALGVGGIIVLTGTDLSAGRIMGLMACVSASLLQRSDFALRMFPNLNTASFLLSITSLMQRSDFLLKIFPNLANAHVGISTAMTNAYVWVDISLVLLLVMMIGGIFGVFNGFFVSKFKLHPFIVTLATSIMLNGVVLWYVQLGGNGGSPISGLLPEYTSVVKDNVMIGNTAIPYYVFYAIVATVIMWFIWNKTTLGKNMYAVGANPEAANVSGVSIMRTTVLIFVIAGILYGFSGFIEAARIGSNGPTTGVMAELDAIAACVIGGVSFTGGTGKISGIVTGVILLQIIAVALQWLGVSSDMRLLITGALILIAVTIDMRKYLAKK